LNPDVLEYVLFEKMPLQDMNKKNQFQSDTTVMVEIFLTFVSNSGNIQ